MTESMTDNLDTPSLVVPIVPSAENASCPAPAPLTPPVPASDPPDSDRGILDATKRQRIIALVANGSSRRKAAKFVGCSPSTITRTAARDPQFAEDLARAEENIEIHMLRALKSAATTDRYWRAAAWLLERTNPEDFGARRPDLYTAAQVLELFAKLLASLHDELAEDRRAEALASLSALLLECESVEVTR